MVAILATNVPNSDRDALEWHATSRALRIVPLGCVR